MDLFSLDSVILIIVTCNCLPFLYSKSIFRWHISWQVLKIAFGSLQILWGRIPPGPPTRFWWYWRPVTKNLATALIAQVGLLRADSQRSTTHQLIVILSTADVNDHKRIAFVLNDLWLAEAVLNSQISASVKFYSTFSTRWFSLLTPPLL